MRRSFSCSILLLGMLFRKLPRRNCKCSYTIVVTSKPIGFHSWNRNWRYHKELRLWLTKETGTTPWQKVPGGEQGTYSYWDPENWEKARKEMTVLYADLEEKQNPLFAPSQTLQLNNPPAHQQQSQPAQQRVGAFQGMGMAAM